MYKTLRLGSGLWLSNGLTYQTLTEISSHLEPLKNIQNASLAIPVGFNKEEIASSWECIKDVKKPRLQVELPVSTIQMEYTYHVKQSVMVEKITELVSDMINTVPVFCYGCQNHPIKRKKNYKCPKNQNSIY